MDKLKNKLCLGDAVAVIAVILMGLSVFAVSSFGKTEGDVCVIRTPDSVTVLALSEDTVLDVSSNGIDLSITVKNGEAFVESSSCPDKVCVNSGRVSKSGRTIVCVPARLSLTIETEEDADADIIVG